MKENTKNEFTSGSAHKIKFVTLLVVLVIVTNLANAQVGSSAVPFLNIEPDAQSSGLGHTGVTRIGTANASFWNPALLGFQQEGLVSLSHSNLLPKFGKRYFHDNFSLSTVYREKHTIAFDLTYLNLSKQMATDDLGNELGSFGNYELATGLSYGTRMNENWSFGGGFRYIHSNLAAGQFSDNTPIQVGRSVGFDLATFWQSEERVHSSHTGQLRWGFVLSNIGPGIKYMEDQNRQAISANLRTGLSYEIWPASLNDHRFIIAFDLNKGLNRMELKVSGTDTSFVSMSPLRAIYRSWSSVDVLSGNSTSSLSIANQFTYNMGIEYWYQQMLAVRLGYLYEHPLNGDRKFLTFGTGINYRQMGFDFSYLYSVKEDHPMANTIRITAKYKVPNWIK
jgi:opacity protein-like surface antigen